MTATKTPPQPALQRTLTVEVAELFPLQGEWNEQDFWPLAERNRIIELSDGKLVVPPMPTTEHQDIVGNIYTELRAYIRTKQLGKVSIAPLPVRLWPNKVREPDVLVMLNAHLERIQSQFWGPPDLVVEVISPGTERTDRSEKLQEYALAGVQEYWIVSTESQTVEVYRLENEVYLLDGSYTNNENVQIVSHLLTEFTLPIANVFNAG